MKKNTVYFILILILAGVAIILVLNNKKTTLKKELRDFAIADTSVVDKIFMVDKENNKVELTRVDGKWKVNKKFDARQDAIDVLLETLSNMEVRYPVPKSSHNTVVKRMSNQSTKVEVFSHGNLLKTYFVGGPTQDHGGTYMLLKGSDVPMVVFIPGFNGYLSSRFFTREIDWRDNTIFKYSYPQIYSVTCEHPQEPEKSFRITRLGANKFSIIRLSDNTFLENYDTLAAKTYLSYFKRISFDHFMTQIPKKKKDSILAATPVYIFTVEDINHNKKTIKTFLKDPEKNPKKAIFAKHYPKYDENNMYGYIPGGTYLLMVQYFVFDPLIREPEDFIYRKSTAQKN